jgi:hypothetical protein
MEDKHRLDMMRLLDDLEKNYNEDVDKQAMLLKLKTHMAQDKSQVA